jgi:acetyl-CoA acetyltransferase
VSEDIWLLGVSMTGFGKFADRDTAGLGADAALDALDDAGLTMRDIGVMAVGNRTDMTGDSGGEGLGHRIMRRIGHTGAPIYHVMNSCASGAAALRVAIMAIKAGETSIGLAVGAEHMTGYRPPPPCVPSDGSPATAQLEGLLGTYQMPGVFGHAGTEYAARYEGVGVEQYARVAVKNHDNSVLNPKAQYRKRFTLEEVLGARMVAYPNTLPMCCPNSDGAAAAVVVSGERLRGMPPERRRRAVKISASVLTTDPWVESGEAQFDVNTLTRHAADLAYEQAGVAPEDLDLVELHDCFATAELMHYDNLRLCAPGGAGAFIDSGAADRDGKTPVNVSGGLLSKGHPIGATGIANIYEVATHLRGEAGDRQIHGATVGLTHVIGLGSSCAVHVLERRSPHA